MSTQTELTEMQCGTCGVWHALPKIMYDKCVEEGGFWCCPNGHSRGYKEGRRAREEIRLERDRLKQQLAQRDDDIAALKKVVGEHKGKLANLTMRAKNGVCPCCTRSFTNLRRHMASKHPDFKAEVIKVA